MNSYSSSEIASEDGHTKNITVINPKINKCIKNDPSLLNLWFKKLNMI